MTTTIEFQFCNDSANVTLVYYKLSNGERVKIDTEYQSLAYHSFATSMSAVLSQLKSMKYGFTEIRVVLDQQTAKPYVEKSFTTLHSTGGFSIRNIKENVPSESSSETQFKKEPVQTMEPKVNSQQLAIENSDGQTNQKTESWSSNYENYMIGLKQEIVSEVVNSLKGTLSHLEWPKLLSQKFDGKPDKDAGSWLFTYEKFCFDNKCISDIGKISGLKANLEDDALKWFGTMVRVCFDDWYFWRSLFLAQFCKNRISAAITADQWEYRYVNKLMDYYYQKERFILIGYPTIDENSFVTKVMLGLPEIIQKQLLASNPQSKRELAKTLMEIDKQNVPTEYIGLIKAPIELKNF